MNLHDCYMQYFEIPEAILTLRSKTAVLIALEIYKSYSGSKHSTVTLPESSGPSSYRSRQLADIERELIEKGIVLESETGLKLKSLEAKTLEKKNRLLLPFKFDYSVLTLTALKVLIAIYAEARYSRTPFQITRTQEEIAERAGVALWGVGKALRLLEEHRLLYTKKLWRENTQISLLDPESGTSLFHIGKFYREKLERTPVCLRYASVLYRFDPTGKLTPDSGPMKGCSVNCPFCKSKKKTFRFDSTDDGDHWQCFNCRRSGDSARFYARTCDWPDQGQRLELAEVFSAAGMTPDSEGYDPFADYVEYAEAIDAINAKNALPKTLNTALPKAVPTKGEDACQ